LILFVLNTTFSNISAISWRPEGCTRLAAASDKVYQLLVHGWWFSPGTTASSTTKTGRHDIAEILLKVVLSTKKSINVFIQDLGTYKHKTARIVFTYIFFRNKYLRQPSTDCDFAISWRPVLVVEEAVVPGENHQPWASNW
jgi:hypothetical protein